jgi:hypothetical protein
MIDEGVNHSIAIEQNGSHCCVVDPETQERIESGNL